ncbi:uncharacterized protein [Glycine max]|uniref:uncharacterized protein isoform X1 n=1 Tax=Glycine max TaxID=3847 RepID=UPI0003DE9882|nr:uncharacterized protein LOC100811257 isoform X1 [Glycine max]|eukprot:XP_006589330.1 uncharacterized protein LOC100811257 isoform X1 [Glycine max]
MAEGSSSTDIQRVLAAIKSSEIVEDRVELFNDLRRIELKNVSESDYGSVINCLVIFWENFTCLDVTQCMLNRSIIQVALSYMDFNPSSCLPQFLTLGVRACVWCDKHLKMSLLSSEDSQEDEHSSVFYQLLVEILRFSASTFSTLLKFTDFGDKELMDTVEIFILEALNLTKDSISEAKKIQSFGSEILKVAHVVIDAVVKLCKVRSELINQEVGDEKWLRLDKPAIVDHVINITKCAIEKLSQIGVLAANDGGNSVNILNVSWKGIVSLLQIGGGHFTEVDVANIVLTLLALITEPLKCAAQAWSSSLNEAISVTEAKRIFVPVKFYLINAVKICSLYPHQAYTVYKEITECVLKITCFWIFVSNENLLKCASVVITELLEETTLNLLLSLLNSYKLKLEQKLEVLEWLFTNKGDSHSGLDCPTLSDCNLAWVNDIFCNSYESMSRAKILILGRVVLFINFFRYSLGLDGDMKIAITQKLYWFLDVLVEEDVYSHILVLQFPLLYGSGKTAELVRQPMFTSLLQAFKTFMIVICSSTAWEELESFLLENFFHPHFLCWEIVMECWCFMLRYAETQMANNILSKLCSLLKLLASSYSVFVPYSSFRKLARSICMLLTNGAQSMVNEVYMSLVGDGKSQLSSIFCLALFMEGFPFDLLTDELRKTSIQRIISDYFDFIDNFDEASLVACSSGLFGVPVFILSASLQSLQDGLSHIDERARKFLVAISSNYKSTVDKVIKDRYLQLFSETLGIISYFKKLYTSNDIEQVIMEIQNIFLSEPPALLDKCKPHLAQFLAGLVHMEISESDDDAKSCAVWELYHLLLKERHWALSHLAITAFGYFASRTRCNKLWRFVPEDAALSYDIVSGVESDQQRFMVEFGKFLKKEIALLTLAPIPEQLELLGREGFVLKQMVQKISAIAEEREKCEVMEVDHKSQSHKKRKLPDGINRGVELLKNGLKIIGDGLSQWQLNDFDTTELHVKYLTQFSQLEDVITHFEELTGSGEVCSSSMQSNSRA